MRYDGHDIIEGIGPARRARAALEAFVLRLLCPDACCHSIADVDLDALQSAGVRALILDLDNTLVEWGETAIPPETTAWIARAKRLGLGLCIASNGMNARVEEMSSALGIPAISEAVKPRKRSFREALALLGVAAHEAAVVGDQIFTDVLGGNRMALRTILINPRSARELPTTKLVRRIEDQVVRRLHRKGLMSADAVAVRNGRGRA